MDSANRKIVDFISKQWISEAKSMNDFAIKHGIEEKTVRSMKNNPNYTISFKTIQKICEAREIKLSDFLIMVGL